MVEGNLFCGPNTNEGAAGNKKVGCVLGKAECVSVATRRFCGQVRGNQIKTVDFERKTGCLSL